MPRTITRDWQAFERPNVTYSFNRGTKAHITSITVPAHSDWTSDLHWHETHREFLKIVQGSALVTIGNLTQVFDSAAASLITIERGVIHEWKQDPTSTETLIVEEWTDPADGQKELFFRNLCSSLIDLTAQEEDRVLQPSYSWILPRSVVVTVQLFVIFKAYDNYPVLCRGFPMRFVTYAALRVSGLVGSVFGVEARYDEYARLPGGKED